MEMDMWVMIIEEFSDKRRELFYKEHQKLEDQIQKGITLDPQKNQNHLQFHHQDSRNVDNDDENDTRDQQFSPNYDHSYQNHHFYLQQESGHQFRELYSQLGTQNFEPNLEESQIVKKRSYLPSCSVSMSECTPHVRQKSSMRDCENVDLSFQQTVPQPAPPVSTRSALRRAGVGEIVEVQGGHIVRATGRKDRHSKVCTAKGPRDRRVRLAAHTAIQFYDVQDRLGYDRPSKAVDWLIKKAKASIDELEQLPAWSPTTVNMSTVTRRRGKGSSVDKVVELGENDGANGGNGGGSEDVYEQQQMFGNRDNSGGSLLPPSLDSDAIADTIKSFFPMGGGASAATTRPQMQFQDYTHGDGSGGNGGLLSKSGGGHNRQSQDLRLSLQSFQQHDLMMHSHHSDQQQHNVYHGAAQVGFENPNVGWADNQHQSSPEMGRLHRLVVGWQNQNQHHNNTNIDQHHHIDSNSGGIGLGTGSGGSGSDAMGGFMFNQPPLLQPLFGGQHNQYFTQRGPLQSSNTPSIRAWFSDPSIATSSEHLQAIPIHPQGLSSLGFASGGFSGFHIPTRIQGEEVHDGDLKPSSVSSGSRH